MKYIYLSGPVDPCGEDWDCVSCADLRAKVEAARADDPAAPLTLIINSPGGNVVEGVAMYNFLRAAKVDVVISGMAASIASVIAMAGQHVAMYDNSTLFVHHAWTFAEGNAAQFQEQIDQLHAADRVLIDAYMRKSGRSEADIVALMDGPKGEGSNLAATDALAAGLIDEVLDPMQAVAACLKKSFAHHHDKAAAAAQAAAAPTITPQETIMADPEVTTTVDPELAECGPGSDRPSAEEVVEKKEEKVEEKDDDARISELEKTVEELTAKLAAAQDKLAAQAKFRRVVAEAGSASVDPKMTFPDAVKKIGFVKACEQYPQLRKEYMRAQIRKGSIR